MTAICGFTHKGNVYIAGDTLGSNNYRKQEVTESKVFKKAGFIFGYTDTFRFGEILEYEFVPPEHKEGIKDRAYLIQTFIPKLRETLEKCKFVKGDDKDGNGAFLMGYKGKLYSVQSDWSVIESENKYDSVGCGDEYCRGAMEILKYIPSIKPKDKVIEAIRVASLHNPFVGGRITSVVLKGVGK